MKKVLVAIVVIAVVVGFAIMAISAEEGVKVKEKTKVTETTKGEVTKTKLKAETPEASFEEKTVTIKDGKFTSEKGKVVKTPHKGNVKMVRANYRLLNENDPKNASDNTVVVIKGKKEMELPISSKYNKGQIEKINKLRAVHINETWYMTYNPTRPNPKTGIKGYWEVAHVE